jgi:hypothetical protein
MTAVAGGLCEVSVPPSQSSPRRVDGTMVVVGKGVWDLHMGGPVPCLFPDTMSLDLVRPEITCFAATDTKRRRSSMASQRTETSIRQGALLAADTVLSLFRC